MATDEETRALNYRREQAARQRAAEARERALRGNPGARQALLDAWAPKILAARERQQPDEDCE